MSDILPEVDGSLNPDNPEHIPTWVRFIFANQKLLSSTVKDLKVCLHGDGMSDRSVMSRLKRHDDVMEGIQECLKKLTKDATEDEATGLFKAYTKWSRKNPIISHAVLLIFAMGFATLVASIGIENIKAKIIQEIQKKALVIHE